MISRVMGVALVALSVLGIGLLAGSGLLYGHLVAIATASVFFGVYLGSRARSLRDPWLPTLLGLAVAAKLVGSTARYLVTEVVYGGGDAGIYHFFAIDIAETWRALEIPDLSTVAFGSTGTRFVAWVTGLIYTPYTPSLLGGFWIFALLALLGQILIYLAFRKALPQANLRVFGILIFFWPTMVYWPSSVGKEALLTLFLGIAAWAGASLVTRYQLRWLPVLAGGVLLISMIREHVAALFAGSLITGILLAARPKAGDAVTRRLLILLVGGLALIPLAGDVTTRFGVEFDSSFNTEALESAFSDVGDTTGQGGSAVAGGVIRSPLDIPAGLMKVLFRPLPNEAANPQMLAASLEGALLLSLILWRGPKMIRGFRQLRHSPYLTFAAIYTTLFVWAWSAILNLGILARQRSLVIPFLLTLVAALGWASQPHARVTDRDIPGDGDASTPRTTVRTTHGG